MTVTSREAFVCALINMVRIELNRATSLLKRVRSEFYVYFLSKVTL